jgi:hypothetical protein
MSSVITTHCNSKLLDYLGRAIKKKRHKLKTALEKPEFLPPKQTRYPNMCPLPVFPKTGRIDKSSDA